MTHRASRGLSSLFPPYEHTPQNKYRSLSRRRQKPYSWGFDHRDLRRMRGTTSASNCATGHRLSSRAVRKSRSRQLCGVNVGKQINHQPKNSGLIFMNKPSVSQQALHHMQRKAREAIPSPKPQKRDNTFSKSRDNREDRDTRQTKTDQSQTFPHTP